SSITQNRRTRRSPVLLAATIEIDGNPVAVKLRNLSEQGALIEGDRLPVEGSESYFKRNELRLKSRIVWVHGKYAGVAFETPLKREEVLRHIPTPRPKAQGDFRRPGLNSRPLTQYERTMLSKWIASAQIDLIGE
ncbi:MAG: PilZ domain-containing protein, partial [Sphingomicrobium sp.]